MTSLRGLRVGDVVPIAVPIDREALGAVARRRGQLQRASAREGNNPHLNQARKILRGFADRQAREACRIERAKAFLRRQRFVVFSTAVTGEEDGHFWVGNNRLSAAELVAFATRRGMVG